MKNAIVLCSGGLDSVTTAHYVKNQGYDNIIILFFDYHQKTLKQERKAAIKCSKDLKAKFQEIDVSYLGNISNSLINKKGIIKRIKIKDLHDSSKESEKYYVPCRNSVFLINALALAESLYIKDKQEYDIFVGFKCEGKESYPDTTKEYVSEMNKLSRISCSAKFEIIAPLIEMDKEDIIILADKLSVNLKDTYSCYIGAGKKHCGVCLACRLRQEGFYWSGVSDPTPYKKRMKDSR